MVSFKTFNKLFDTDEELSEAKLTEIFGIFSNNARLDRIKQAQKKLIADRQARKKERDTAWANAKAKVERDEEENGGFNTAERGSHTMRSAQAKGRAAELDWISNITR